MKKTYLLTLLLSYSIVCFSQSFETQPKDSLLSPTIIIEETADSPFVVIYLSPAESYIAEYTCPNFWNRKHLDKVSLPSNVAEYLYLSTNKFCIAKESPKFIHGNAGEESETIRYDLIHIPLKDHNRWLFSTTEKKESEENKYSLPYIQYIECIDSLSVGYRKRIVSHSGELDPLDPALKVSDVYIDTLEVGRPFYGVDLYCTFLNITEEMFKIRLTFNKSIIHDWRGKHYGKYLPKEIVDWLYGQIKNGVNAIEDADNNQHFLNPQIYNTLNEHILEYPLRIDIMENEDGSERETYINGGENFCFSSEFIDVVMRICKSYYDTCYK